MLDRLMDIACGICLARFINATSEADILGMIVFGGAAIGLFLFAGNDREGYKDDDIQ